MLSEKDIQAFKQIYEAEFNEVLSDEQANALALKVYLFFMAILKPING